MDNQELQVQKFVMLQVGKFYIDGRNFIIYIGARDREFYVSHLGQRYYKDGTAEKAENWGHGLDLLFELKSL